MVQDTYQQAAAFWYCYGHCLTPEQKTDCTSICYLAKSIGKGKRIFLLFRYRLEIWRIENWDRYFMYKEHSLLFSYQY